MGRVASQTGVLIERDARQMRALISWEDYQYLRRLARVQGVAVAEYVGNVLTAHVETEREEGTGNDVS